MKNSFIAAFCGLALAASFASAEMTLKSDPQAKKAIAPQSLMVHSSLMSAKAQLQGLKSQLQIADTSKPDATFLNQVKTYDRNIDSTIKEAANRQNKVKDALIKSYPQVANQEEVKTLDYSINDLESFFRSWSNKSSERTYWRDKDQARADLDSLDRRLDKAIGQSKTFNADQLDLSVG